MKKIGAIFYFIVGLMGVILWGYNMVRAFDRIDVFMVGAFGLLTLLSGLLSMWAVKEFKSEL